MECLIKEMQDPEHGVPVRSQKIFLSSIPAAFAGYDIIEWLMERLSIEDSGKKFFLRSTFEPCIQAVLNSLQFCFQWRRFIWPIFYASMDTSFL